MVRSLLCFVLTALPLGACSQQHARSTPLDNEPLDWPPEPEMEDGEEPPPRALEPEASTDGARGIAQPPESPPDAVAPPVSASANAGPSADALPPSKICQVRRVGIAKESSFDCGVDLGFQERDPKYVQVLIDGVSVPFEPNDGFSWAGTTVVLRGSSCSLLNDLEGHELYIQLACKEPKLI